MAEPYFEIKLYIDGQLVDYDRVTAANAGDLSSWHTDKVTEAIQAGRKWMLEIADPDLPPEQRYLRFGSDEAGMVDPQSVDIMDVAGEAERRFLR